MWNPSRLTKAVFERTHVSLHHVKMNARVCVTTRFWWRPRYALHGFSQSTMGKTDEDLFYNAHLDLQERMQNPIMFHAKMMGNIMYLQQAHGQSDAKEFVQAVVKEVNRHVWTPIIGPSRNKMKFLMTSRLCHLYGQCNASSLTTNAVNSHNARFNLHNGKQFYWMNYFKSHAPVVTWFAIRLMIIFGIIVLGWALCQVDFVMAYPQAPIKMDIYKELPQGIQTAHGNSKDHMLKLEKNIYGQKQASLELIPCGQAHVQRIHTFPNRWLCFLPRWHHFHGLCKMISF